MKKTILFYNANNVGFDGSTISKRPISGSETAFIQMAKQFAQNGWNTHAFCTIDVPGVYDKVVYHDSYEILDWLKDNPVDVFVSSRDVRPFLQSDTPGYKILWCHDMPQVPSYDKLLDALPNLDKIFFVSQFQANAFRKKFDYQIPDDKIHITRNGIDESRFVKPVPRIRGSCIYCTTPFRGLDVLLDIWPKIHKAVPGSRLDVFSDMSIYQVPETPDTMILYDYAKTIADKTNLHMHPPIKQNMLALRIKATDVMLYPCHFEETSCITAMEAIKAKTPIITSDFAALPETICIDEGRLVPGSSYDEGYEETFVKEAIKMLTDDEYRASFCQNDRDLSWDGVLIDWLRVIPA